MGGKTWTRAGVGWRDTASHVVFSSGTVNSMEDDAARRAVSQVAGPGHRECSSSRIHMLGLGAWLTETGAFCGGGDPPVSEADGGSLTASNTGEGTMRRAANCSA